MRGQAVSHTAGAHAQSRHVVVSVTIQELHASRAGGAVHGAVGSVGAAGRAIIRIIEEAEIVKAAVGGPEVVVGITGQHHGSLAAGIGIRTGGGVLQSAHAKLVLQGDGRAIPLSPHIAELVEAVHAQVALERVLGGPRLGRRIPVPGNEALNVFVVLHAEDIRVVLHELTAGVLNDILGIGGGLVQVFLVQGTGNTGLLQVHLGKQRLCGIIVNTPVLVGHLLGKELHGFVQQHHNVVVHIGLGRLVYIVVAVVANQGAHVVDDGHFTEAAHQEEVSEGFPGKSLTLAHVHGGLVHALHLFETVVHRGSVSVHGPQRRRHVTEFLVGAVYRELEVRAAAHVIVTGEALAYTVEAADEVIPGRVVQVVDTLDALLLVLIEVLGVVAVLGGTVQELFAGRSGYQHNGCNSDIFQNIFHILCSSLD